MKPSRKSPFMGIPLLPLFRISSAFPPSHDGNGNDQTILRLRFW
jgi:hypothetical protein